MKQRRHARPSKPIRLFPYSITPGVASIPSAMDQTGLIPVLPLTDSEADAYEGLYPIDGQESLE